MRVIKGEAYKEIKGDLVRRGHEDTEYCGVLPRIEKVKERLYWLEVEE